MGVAPTSAGSAVQRKSFDASIYAYSGAYDHARFLAAFKANVKTAGFAATTDEDILELLGFIEADMAVTDLRWTAYLLATAFWEGRSKVREMHQVIDRKGRPLVDKKGNKVERTITKWRIMQATEEIGHGRGRRYHEPVKITLDPSGDVLVTEHDGDQWTVNPLGHIKPKKKKIHVGAKDGAPAAKAYADSKGAEESYYGRGFVQLTWWDNYVRAGVELGLGDLLLIHPEKLKEPSIAYRVMAHGMRTGKIFANGHKLADYFTGTGSDYVGARAMVNGVDHDEDIAAIARNIEAALLLSKVTATRPAAPGAGRIP